MQGDHAHGGGAQRRRCPAAVGHLRTDHGAFMSQVGHRIVQVVLLTFSLFMLCGGGVFWRDVLPESGVRTTTYTLYRTVPSPPERAHAPWCRDRPAAARDGC